MFRQRTTIQRISRRIWLHIGGGALLFIGTALTLAAISGPIPANQIVNRYNVLLFVPSVILVFKGAYISMRDWRCL
jgi:hypothetical protein